MAEQQINCSAYTDPSVRLQEKYGTEGVTVFTVPHLLVYNFQFQAKDKQIKTMAYEKWKKEKAVKRERETMLI